jgi:ABC-type branched-subunit amino acid transport system substrate-binding protein
LRGTRLLALAGTVTALSFGVAACGSDSGSDSSSSSSSSGGGATSLDLTIGNLVPLSGDLADFGPPGQKAAELAVDQINSAIDETGDDHTVTLQTEDDQTSDQAAVSAARKLVDGGASCIAGSWASSVTIPVSRSVTSREGVLQISPASTSDEITGLEDNNLLDRTVPPDSFQGPVLANVIADALGGAEGKTVNIGARNDSYGNGLVDTFSGPWEDMGGKIGETVIYDPTQPSYDSEAQQIVGGSPDATVFFDFPETFVKVGPALARAGWDPSTAFGTDGLASSSLPEDVGADVVEGFRGTAPGSPQGSATSEAFDKAYTAFDPTDVERQTFDSQNFDAVILCYLAAVAAGSTDGADMADVVQGVSGPPGTKYTFEQLPDAIKALENGDDIDYEGASGPIDMDEAGDATAGVYDVYEYKGGKINPSIKQFPLEPGSAG